MTWSWRRWSSGCVVWAALVFVVACEKPETTAPAAIEQTASDEAVELTLRVARDRISVADSLTLHLEAAFPETLEVVFPDALGRESELRSSAAETSSPRLDEDGRVRVEQTYQIEPYVAGQLNIPAIEVLYRDKGSLEEEKAITTKAFQVEVEPVLSAEEEDAELRDIHDPLAVPFPVAWLIGGALAALAAAVGAYWWRRSAPAAPAAPEAPREPADVLALRRLEELLAQGLGQAGRIKELYGGVSDILRQYIEARFGLHAPEQTTEEFLAELRRTLGFDPAHRALLRTFLEHTDLVKFAEARPSAEQVDRTVEACRRFIVETKPQPEAAEGPVVPRA